MNPKQLITFLTLLFSSNLDAATLDIVILPGLQVNYSDCSVRKLMEYRVQRAYHYSKNLTQPHFIVSGKGNPGNPCAGSTTEASAMAALLISKWGVAPTSITLEEQATATSNNATYVKQIVDQMQASGHQINSLALVSSNYHMHRGSGSSDTSATRHFNNAFGAGTFVEGQNAVSSSQLDMARAWLSGDLTENYGWRVASHDRLLAKINGDQANDIVAFGNRNDVYVATANSLGNGFNSKRKVINCAFSIATSCDSWDTVNNLRFAADVNGDNFADLIGITADAIIVHLNNGDGINSFGAAKVWLNDLTQNNGGWSKDHVRHLADVNADGRADIVAFGNDNVFVSLSTGTQFASKTIWSNGMGKNDGWNNRNK